RSVMDRTERPCLTVMRAGEVKVPRGTGEEDSVNCDLSIEILGTIAQIEEESEIPEDRAAADLQDDVEKALHGVDWTGLQVLEEPRTVAEPFEPEDPEDGFVMSLTVRYAHKIGDSTVPLAPEP